MTLYKNRDIHENILNEAGSEHGWMDGWMDELHYVVVQKHQVMCCGNFFVLFY